MSSVIQYRFFSNKFFSKVFFEGSGIPLWELRSEIISQKKLVSKDFDLLFYDANTNEQIVDEYQTIFNNSEIIIKRIPLWMSKKPNVLFDQKASKKVEKSKRDQFLGSLYRQPPPNYVCFRCGKKGHFIQHCPTNEDKNFDILKIRKPSGIPKAFLKPVIQEEADGAMLVTKEGSCVRAEPQVQEWKAKRTKTYQYPPDLCCRECESLVIKPVLTNCNHLFCMSCVNTDTQCTICKKTIETITVSEEIEKKVREYLQTE